MKRFVLPLILLALAGCYNFHEVVPGEVYRSAQPQKEELSAWIRNHDIKTVLRLRGGEPGRFWYDESKAAAEEAGITFIQIPMSANRFPRKTELNRLLDTFDSAEYPLLMHCRAGADRTGLASAVVLLNRGESVEKAARELSIRYAHTGIGTGALDEVLEMYRPFEGEMSFREWVNERYEVPAQK